MKFLLVIILLLPWLLWVPFGGGMATLDVAVWVGLIVAWCVASLTLRARRRHRTAA